MSEGYRQSCPGCASRPIVASRDEERHRRQASEFYAAARQAFSDANEERNMAAGEGHHKHNGCSRASHLAEALESDKAAHELSGDGDREMTLADQALLRVLRGSTSATCSLCGGRGAVSGNGSAQTGGNGRAGNSFGR